MACLLVKLECLTNLHVGNGDVNYNIIDNEVEKDPVTGLPTINASGVKGALRSYFKDKVDEDTVVTWFGSQPNEKSKHIQGKLKILGANILVMPLRATAGSKPFYLVSTDDILDQYKNLCTSFGVDNCIKKSDLGNAEKNVSVEGYSLNNAVLTSILGVNNIYVVKDANTKAKLKKIPLPVIARNNLENGISTNLWYEEVVPHESVFYFFVISDDSDKKAILEPFGDSIKNIVIQFGGNASIGYGLCMVSVQEV